MDFYGLGLLRNYKRKDWIPAGGKKNWINSGVHVNRSGISRRENCIKMWGSNNNRTHPWPIQTGKLLTLIFFAYAARGKQRKWRVSKESIWIEVNKVSDHHHPSPHRNYAWSSNIPPSSKNFPFKILFPLLLPRSFVSPIFAACTWRFVEISVRERRAWQKN